MVVEQFLSGFHYGDAVGNSVLRFHRFLLSKGIDSKIVAITIDERFENDSVSFNDYKARDDSIKIYHFSISSPLSDFFITLKGFKILIYHNITPSHFFFDYSENLVRSTLLGREELDRLSDVFNISIADSEYNSEELKKLGFRNIKVFPIMIDIEDYKKEFIRGMINSFKKDKRNILFVGRVMPNKKIEDLIKFISVYRNLISSPARLIIAGNRDGLPRYYHSLMNLADRLNISSEDLIFTGHIPFEELISIYSIADVFLSMSEHEGFCLPLIESMIFKVPVIAFSAGAVDDTLGGTGIIFKEKKFEKLVFLADKIMSDKNISNGLINLYEERLNTYIKESDPGKLLSIISGESE